MTTLECKLIFQQYRWQKCTNNVDQCAELAGERVVTLPAADHWFTIHEKAEQLETPTCNRLSPSCCFSADRLEGSFCIPVYWCGEKPTC